MIQENKPCQRCGFLMPSSSDRAYCERCITYREDNLSLGECLVESLLEVAEGMCFNSLEILEKSRRGKQSRVE